MLDTSTTEVSKTLDLCSPTVTEITKALCAAIAEFKPVLKDKNNTFFKAKYADLASFIEASQSALAKHGLVVLQPPMVAPPGNIRVLTRLQHTSGEFFQSDTIVPMAKNDPQAFGSAVTYVRRYALAAMIGLAPEDDDGNSSSSNATVQNTVAAKEVSKAAAKPAHAAPATTPLAEVKLAPTPVNTVDAAAKSEAEVAALIEMIAKVTDLNGVAAAQTEAIRIKKTWPGVEKSASYVIARNAFKAKSEEMAKAAVPS